MFVDFSWGKNVIESAFEQRPFAGKFESGTRWPGACCLVALTPEECGSQAPRQSGTQAPVHEPRFTVYRNTAGNGALAGNLKGNPGSSHVPLLSLSFPCIFLCARASLQCACSLQLLFDDCPGSWLALPRGLSSRRLHGAMSNLPRKRLRLAKRPRPVDYLGSCPRFPKLEARKFLSAMARSGLSGRSSIQDPVAANRK